MKPALLVIDIQNAYLPMMSAQDREIGLQVINEVIKMFRDRDLPVIRVYHTEPQHGPEPGSDPFEFPSTVIVEPDDPKIVKNHPSAFKNTGLEKLLRDLGCDTVFLCGLSAVGCALATYFGAVERDFEAFMIKYGIMSHNSAYTSMVAEITDAIGCNLLNFVLAHSS